MTFRQPGSSPPRLRAAAAEFGITPSADTEADSRTRERVTEVAGPLKSTMLLFDDGAQRICLVASHIGWTTPVNVSDVLRQTLADDLRMPKSHVIICSSHNHCCMALASNATQAYHSYTKEAPPAKLLPIGQEFLDALRRHAAQLADRLEPVSVWFAQGHENRITYNRKGVMADGTSYLMREQDRLALGPDFCGDIDTQAPIVVLKNTAGRPIAALVQFTGHPVTAYHPEKPIVFGEWPQVACDDLSARLSDDAGGAQVPVAFLQGCAGDVNSKEMFFGGVERSTEFGHMLAENYIAALDVLEPAQRDGFDFATAEAGLPLGPLPPREVLLAELGEMDDFIARARAGDENTLLCVGQNFDKALSPPFRANIVELIRGWNIWALGLYDEGRAGAVPTELNMEVVALRLGDVGIVGLPCEAFQGIGRQIRRQSPLPLAIPCGYTNTSHGYIPDGANVGGNEYMSAHHRYTKFRPPLRKPGGDVLAAEATRLLGRFAKESGHRS